MKPGSFYLFASGTGKPIQSSATVFYKVEGAERAKSLCVLFTKEYGDTNGHTVFHHVAAESISAQDQVLLDETLECLEVYHDPDPGLYDPKPPEDIFQHAQYMVRARTWEELLSKKSTPTEPDKKQNPNVEGISKPLTMDRLPDISAEDWRNALKSVGATGGAAPPYMSAEEWQNAGLNALMLLAQAYYKILESAIRVPCAAVDLDLNQSYLWVINAIGKLFANHPDLKDFPMSFEPPFQDLFPSSILDLDWEDMIAPEAEKFLSTVQEYVFRKGIYDPEKGSPVWIFIEIIRPNVISAIEKADAYNKCMTQSMQKILKTVSQTAAGRFASGVAPTAPAATDSKPAAQPTTPTPPGNTIEGVGHITKQSGQSCKKDHISNQIKFRDRIFEIKMIMPGNLNANEEGHFDPINENTYLWQIFIDDIAIDIKPRKQTDEGLLWIMTLDPPLEIIKYSEWHSGSCQFLESGHMAPVNKKTGLYDKSYEPEPDYIGFYKFPNTDGGPFEGMFPRSEYFEMCPRRRFEYLHLPIPIRCIVRDTNAEEKLLLKQHHEHIGSKAKPVQSTEDRVEKRPSVAVALLRALEKEQMEKPKVNGSSYMKGKDGKLIHISKHHELDRAKKDVETSMFQAGVYKEAQRRSELLESDLYDAVDEDRKAVLEWAIWLQKWLTREVLQEINATPNHDEREYIMVLEDEKLMRHEDWNKEIKEREQKTAEKARKLREKEELSKQEEAEKLRDITKSVQNIGQMQTELARQTKKVALQVAAARSAKPAMEAVPDMLTIPEAAKYARVDKRTIYNWIHNKTNRDGTPMLAGVSGTNRLTYIPRKSLEPFRKRVKTTPNKHRKRPSRKAVKK